MQALWIETFIGMSTEPALWTELFFSYKIIQTKHYTSCELLCCSGFELMSYAVQNSKRKEIKQEILKACC